MPARPLYVQQPNYYLIKLKFRHILSMWELTAIVTFQGRTPGVHSHTRGGSPYSSSRYLEFYNLRYGFSLRHRHCQAGLHVVTGVKQGEAQVQKASSGTLRSLGNFRHVSRET